MVLKVPVEQPKTCKVKAVEVQTLAGGLTTSVTLSLQHVTGHTCSPLPACSDVPSMPIEDCPGHTSCAAPAMLSAAALGSIGGVLVGLFWGGLPSHPACPSSAWTGPFHAHEVPLQGSKAFR